MQVNVDNVVTRIVTAMYADISQDQCNKLKFGRTMIWR